MNRDFDNENHNIHEGQRGRSRRKGASSGGYTGVRVSRMAAEGPSAESALQGQQDWSRKLNDRQKGSERPGRRNKKKDKKPSWRPLIIVLIVLEIFILIGIGAVRYVLQMEALVRRDESINMEAMTNANLTNNAYIETMQGYWTVALFGVDSRNGSLGRGNNSDVNIICNVNLGTGDIKLVSVYRDTYLNIDDDGSYNKINQAYLQGGPSQAIQALNRNLDLQMDDYATFNWKAVVDAINILGGVDIELSKAEFYYINAYITETVKATGVGSYQLTHAGMNHLDGVQAVAYARLRYMDTDFARTERQRKVIQLCFEKLKKADFATINNVMETVLGQIETSITLDDLIPAAKNITRYNISETTGFPQARTNAMMGRKGDCVIPATLSSNVTDLHEFLFDEQDYVPSAKVQQISAKIASDSGKYQEAAPVESVGTGGGSIPSTTSSETQEEETEESTVEGETLKEETRASETTEEGIIDGEYPWDLELETDEDGNYVDPPEGWYNNETQARPSQPRPGSGSLGPGHTTSSTESTQESQSSGPSGIISDGPQDIISEDEFTGPGVTPVRPTLPTTAAPSASQELSPVSPGNPSGTVNPTASEQSQSGPGAVIIGPAGN